MARLGGILLVSGLLLAAARTGAKPSSSSAVQAAQQQLESAAKEDEGAHEKAGCFCQTKVAETQQTVENMQQQLIQLGHDLDESSARISQLDIDVRTHQQELETNSKALATANALREKDADKFADDQQTHTQSISQLKSALEALRNHNSIDVALLTIRKVTVRSSGRTQRGQLLQLQQHLRGKSSPAVVNGVLQHMVTTFSKDLQALKEDEETAKNRHEAIVAAKTEEMQSQKKHMLSKQQQSAKLKATVGFNEQIKDRSSNLLDANIKLLSTLKQLCQRSDTSFSTRRDAIQAEIEALSSAQAELAGASLLSVHEHMGVRGDGAEKICSASIEIQEKAWKKQAQAACKQARKGDAGSKQLAAEAIEELESDIRQSQDETTRKQDDCLREIQGARDEAKTAAKQDSAEAEFVGSEQQSAEEQLQDLTSQSANADKSKSDYDQVVAGQLNAIQELRVATSQGKQKLEYAAGRASVSAASKINEAVMQSEKLMKESNELAGDLQAGKQQLAGLLDTVRLAAGKVMIPVRLMKAESEEDAIAIKEKSASRAHAVSPKCDAATLSAEVAKFKKYRFILGRAAEGLAWETLR